MVNIDGDRPAVEDGELGVVRQDLRCRRAGILDLDPPVRFELFRVHRERSVGVEGVATVLPDDDGRGAVRLRGCDEV